MSYHTATRMQHLKSLADSVTGAAADDVEPEVYLLDVPDVSDAAIAPAVITKGAIAINIGATIRLVSRMRIP